MVQQSNVATTESSNRLALRLQILINSRD